MKKKTSPVSLLKGVKELLSSRTRWTIRVFARNKKSEAVRWDNTKACKWCLLGALYNIGQEYEKAAEIDAMRALNCSIPNICTITTWNDETGHKGVLNTIDDAIKWLRKRK